MIDEEIGKRLRIGEILKAAHLTIDNKNEDLIEAQRQIYKLNKQ